MPTGGGATKSPEVPGTCRTEAKGWGRWGNVQNKLGDISKAVYTGLLSHVNALRFCPKSNRKSIKVLNVGEGREFTFNKDCSGCYLEYRCL